MRRITAVFLVSLLIPASCWAGLLELESEYRTAYQVTVGESFAASLADLDRRYADAVERSSLELTKAGRLEEALALKGEVQRIQDKAELPDSDEGVPPTLGKLRATYRQQLAKLITARGTAAAPLVQKFGAALAALQAELASEGKLDEALAVKDYVATGLIQKLTDEPVAMTVATATPDRPFVNGLRMRFVTVPITGGPTEGKTIRFCIWETRVQDYEKYVKDAKQDWPKPNFKQRPDHPAVMLNWTDANAFCLWLTNEEQRKRIIGPKDVYRLPSDHEWSCAVGIGKDENATLAPVAKTDRAKEYPWGNEFPPPKETGNYNGQENKSMDGIGQKPIPNYDDGFAETSPVGSFPANPLGLFDLSGNVREWCLDWHDPATQKERVLRGGSWDSGMEVFLRSCRRDSLSPSYRGSVAGFRVVLEIASGS